MPTIRTIDIFSIGLVVCALFFPLLGQAESDVVSPTEASSPEAPVENSRVPTVIFRSCIRPAYPADAVRENQTGTVRMKLFISAEGVVRDKRVVLSSGWRILDVAALAAYQSCKFKPAIADGVAVAAWVEVEYRWKIEP